MRKILLVILLVLLLTSCQKEPVEEEVLNIFNQDEPGLSPQLFAPGVISTDSTSEFAGTFSPDYKYFFFTRRNEYNRNRLFYSEFIDGEWSIPALSPISEEIDEFEPFITPDGSTIYFGSKREGNSSLVIYQSSFLNGEWQTPVFVDNGLNDGFAMYISVSDNGNIYYTSSEGISVMIKDGDSYINEFTGISGAHSFIAPDESYMLFDDSGGTEDDTSIYIVFKDGDSWGTPVKLGEEVNAIGSNQICASISPDGKYLFFSRFTTGSADIYWVDAQYLDQYK